MLFVRGHRRSLRLIAKVNMQTFRFEKQPGPPFLRWRCRVFSFAGRCADCLNRLCFPLVALVRSNVPQERRSASNMPRMTVSRRQSGMPMQHCCFGCLVTILQRQLPHSPPAFAALAAARSHWAGQAHLRQARKIRRTNGNHCTGGSSPPYACNQNMK